VGVGGENLLLDCYRLAKHYSQSPDVFLNMPMSEVRMHMMRTLQLMALGRQGEDE